MRSENEGRILYTVEKSTAWPLHFKFASYAYGIFTILTTPTVSDSGTRMLPSSTATPVRAEQMSRIIYRERCNLGSSILGKKTEKTARPSKRQSLPLSAQCHCQVRSSASALTVLLASTFQLAFHQRHIQ